MAARRLARALVCLALPAAGCVAAPPAPEAVETISPEYSVFLRPRALVALDVDDDRFDLGIGRRTPTSAVTAYHLTLTIRHGDRTLKTVTKTAPATPAGQAAFQESGIVPVWPVIRYGRLAGLGLEWQYDGFVLDAVVRENSAEGRLVYRLHDPNAVLKISRWGLYARYWPIVLAFGLVLAAVPVAGAAIRAGPLRRASLRFDLGALALLGLVSAAFSYWALLAMAPLALGLAFVPVARKARLVEGFHQAARSVRAVSWPVRLAAMSPAVLTVALAAWWLAWHHTLVRALAFSLSDVREFLQAVAGGYLAAALVFSLAVHATLRRRHRNRRSLGPVALSAWAVLGLSAVMRGLDWGTFYYTAGHVDDDFWAHAFYRENLGFAASPLVVGILAVLLVAGMAAAGLLRLACRYARLPEGIGPSAADGRETARGLPWLNAVAAVLAVAAAHVAWAASAPGPTRDVSDGIRLAIAGVPEYQVVEPLAVRLLQRAPDAPVLDAAFVAKLERAGLRLNAVDPEYPLLKPSVYLDPRRRDGPKPAAPPRANVIVIMVEALSSALIDERVHGVRGLTPNIDDFAAHAFTFRNLYSSDYPTIKGELATLASFCFDHHGLSTTGNAGNPLTSNYVFLSDVLKAAGYSTLHVQSDYASFGGTAGLFRRHHYDTFLSAEDRELSGRARHPLTKRWGLFDEDTFRTVTEMLERRSAPSPFLLTIATTDTHFPYASLRRHPGADGNDLLNAVHSTDQAFGLFWDYFKRSPWSRNTIVLLTADHALAIRAVRYGQAGARRSVFDYITGMLYVPGNPEWAGGGTDTTCTQLDLTPTLLDVLGIDVPNPFLGLSIFSERPRYPLALSRSLATDRLSASDREAVRAIGWTQADQDRLMAWLRYLAVADRIAPRTR